MILSNLHTHTTFSDGADTHEEMAQRAVELGFCSLGFSDHSETLCDPSYCMAKKDYSLYQKAIREIQKRYEGKLEVFCGIEQDQLSEIDPSEYDYVIGSVHYVSLKGQIYSVDHTPETQKAAIEACGGDPIELAKRYYDLVVENNAVKLPVKNFEIITLKVTPA
jgi:histidinol-phosphatase (PHP family)